MSAPSPILELVPLEFHEELLWLARNPKWMTYLDFPPRVGGPNAGRPQIGIHVDLDLLKGRNSVLSRALVRAYQEKALPFHAYAEAAAESLRSGPKLFRPTAEQFESMGQVEIHLPIETFRSPYPAMFIQVPQPARESLANRHDYPINFIPTVVLVRSKEWKDDFGRSRMTVYIGMKIHGESEQHIIFHDSKDHDDLEAAFNYRVNHNGENPADKAFEVSTEIGRSSLNLCLMLTQYGHRITGPVDPVAYAKHRKAKSGYGVKLRTADCVAVECNQKIQVRAPVPPGAEPVHGSGTWEVKPHWRKGHWRRLPGYEAYEARGEKPPITFVRPCLVRPDRLVGDASQTSTEYISKPST